MRDAIPLLVALGLWAWTGRAPTEMDRLPPPTLSVSTTTRVLAVASGAPDLDVSA